MKGKVRSSVPVQGVLVLINDIMTGWIWGEQHCIDLKMLIFIWLLRQSLALKHQRRIAVLFLLQTLGLGRTMIYKMVNVDDGFVGSLLPRTTC